MNTTNETRAVTAVYETRFGSAPEVVTAAPGRVNLLGEHTDYNGGLVLPIALKDIGVTIALGRGARPGMVEIWSETFSEADSRSIDEGKSGRWSDYVLGCVKAVAQDRLDKSGLQAVISTTLPMGAGLSSSAALEVAVIRALTSLFKIPLSPIDIALTARRVENDFVGMPCGIMDQFVVSVGVPGDALFLDTRTLEYRTAPGLTDHNFVVVHSGVSHQLTDSGYRTRVAECQAACKALGVAMLSDLGTADGARIAALPEPLVRRARHIVTDNRLTREGLAALEANDAGTFGRLMVESHASESADYEITVPETDAIARVALDFGALGARQTGGGWGGSVVALVPTSQVARWSAEMAARFSRAKILAVT